MTFDCLLACSRGAFSHLIRWLGIVGSLVLVHLLVLTITAAAQSRFQERYSDRPTIGNLLGDLARAGARSSAQKKWSALPLPMQDCLGRSLSVRGYTTARLIEQGVGPDDTRLTDMSARCQTLLTRELQKDIECSILELGVSVSTRCNEVFGVGNGSQLRTISRDQYILGGIRGENVTVTQVETSEAREARIAIQQQKQAAEEEVLRKQHEAAEALAMKEAEAARKKQAAEIATLQQKLSQRDSEILAQRKRCVAKPEGNALTRLFSKDDEHRITATLLDTNVPPLKVYQGTAPWLLDNRSKAVVTSALQDRIAFDAKLFGETVSRSGSGPYSWEALKGVLAVFANYCQWDQYDYLAINSARAMSPQSMAVAIGLTPSLSTGDRVGGVVLTKVPSAKFFSYIKKN